MNQEGITVECVHCKARKTIGFDQAAKLDGPPMCEVCGMPMVAIEATVRNKRPTAS